MAGTADAVFIELARRHAIIHAERQATAPSWLARASWMLMLEKFLAFITETVSGHAAERPFADNDYRLAAAALLIHVISLDGEPSVEELHKLQLVIEDRFNFDAARARQLIAAASAAEDESVDLYRFTSRINRNVDEAGRRRIVEMMWEMVFADRRVSELEESVVWRAADLLGLSARERLELRQQVARSLDTPDDAGG